jgi:hypothetical protein
MKDHERFGSISDVTDHEYYTNSFHIPVYYSLFAVRIISLEATFHELYKAAYSENLTFIIISENIILPFRGSTNQRIIDIQANFKQVSKTPK